MWINTLDKLPENNTYVLAKHNRNTWHDKDDQDHVNYVVVKFVQGLSKEARIKLAKSMTEEEFQRSITYSSEDEWGNNEKPYYWNTFGPDSFFGQEITQWKPLDDDESISAFAFQLGKLIETEVNTRIKNNAQREAEILYFSRILTALDSDLVDASEMLKMYDKHFGIIKQ